MKTIKFIVASAIAAGSISAQADVRNMSGFYAGGNFGYSAGTGKTSSTSVNNSALRFNHNGDTSTTGMRGGLHFGYGQIMQNKLYLGLEASADLSNNKGKRDANMSTNTGLNRDVLFSMKRRDSFGLALRGGAMLNSVLMYGKIGVDTAKWKFNASQNYYADPGAQQNSAKSQRLAGLVLGLGAETMITDHITTGVEWAHTRYRKASTLVLSNAPGQPGQIEFKAQPRTNDFRVRLSYKW